jgi:hypothetical protein
MPQSQAPPCNLNPIINFYAALYLNNDFVTPVTAAKFFISSLSCRRWVVTFSLSGHRSRGCRKAPQPAAPQSFAFCQNVPSNARVAAGAFGFLTLIQVFDGPERYGASSLFETMPSRPSLQTALNILAPSPSECSTY